MQNLYLTAQIRAIEQAHGTQGLMEKAGLSAAELARDLAQDGLPILVLAGPGNNAGDAFVAARWLKVWWFEVHMVFLGDRATLPADAADAFDAWLTCGGATVAEIPASKNYGLVIDGLFGIGLARSLNGRYAQLITQANALHAVVLAIDIPSGLCADSGRVLGTAMRADHTLTFIGLKPGLFTLDGPDHAGKIHLADLGITPSAESSAGCGQLLDTPPALPPRRRKNSHKGSYGSAGVLGGATAMTGAALLAARAALLTGAGRVYAGLLAENAPAVDQVQPELMLRDAAAIFELDHLDALVAGPGLGQSEQAQRRLQTALRLPAPLLLDADALNLAAGSADLRPQVSRRQPGTTVITPHPGEAAALLDSAIPTIQSDRIGAALALAGDYNAVAVLKGCGSVIATPDGRWFINASGNPGMASAGMGDVLAGIIGGLLAQGMECENATLLGVHLHGAAADQLVAAGYGPLGLTAGEVALAARDLLNQWINES
jgi:ADP-dependent NAD(P)H-hydrate dehydratase / NAD(P)H-hydrate epimerase